MNFPSWQRVFPVFLWFVALTAAAGPADDARLDQRFTELRQAPDEQSARQIEQAIWKLWMISGNPEVDALMPQVLEARRWGDYAKAIELLDRVTEIDPEYAEAWNQRATLHFLRGEYEQSLAAVATTLELEPRHFGALAGRALIRMRQGRTALAIQSIRKAMEYHPYLKERALVPPQYLDQEPH